MTKIPTDVFVYTVQRDGAEVNYVSPLPHEFVTKNGIPPEGIMGQFLDGVDRVTPDNFARNPAFVEFLHTVIDRHGRNCPGLIAEAERTGTGSVSIVDLRVPDPEGAIAPEDIIGAFSVTDGVIEEYHACPRHRILNEFGFIQLDEWFHDKLLEELKAVT